MLARNAFVDLTAALGPLPGGWAVGHDRWARRRLADAVSGLLGPENARYLNLARVLRSVHSRAGEHLREELFKLSTDRLSPRARGTPLHPDHKAYSGASAALRGRRAVLGDHDCLPLASSANAFENGASK
jgi:hypothetical protein